MITLHVHFVRSTIVLNFFESRGRGGRFHYFLLAVANAYQKKLISYKETCEKLFA